MARVYVRSIVPKNSILLAGTGVWKISSVVYVASALIKIDFSDNRSWKPIFGLLFSLKTGFTVVVSLW